MNKLIEIVIGGCVVLLVIAFLINQCRAKTSKASSMLQNKESIEFVLDNVPNAVPALA